MKKLFSLLAIVVVALSGCATIVGDKEQTIPVTSDPSGATVVITDETGKQVDMGSTPKSFTLAKSDGTYFGGKNYTVKISMAGYKTQEIPVTAKANGWFIGGNLVFGGFIGWLVVDPFNGAMYNLSPDKVDGSLEKDVDVANPILSRNNAADNGSISVVLIKDIPAALRDEMKRLN